MADQPKRLYRSRSNKMIAGVCGGVAEFLGVDPTAVRIAWVLLSILPLIPGIILYIIAWIVIPASPPGSSGSTSNSSFSAGTIVGIVLIVVGGVFLLENLDVVDWWRWWDTFWDFAVPGLLIAAGVFFLTYRRKEGSETGTSVSSGPPAEEHKEERRPLTRSSGERKLFGVCGGLGAYFGIDPSLIRVGFVFFSMWPFGLGVVLYLVLLLIMPEGPSLPVRQAPTQTDPQSQTSF